METKINVEMNGKEYMAYRKSKSIPLSKNVKKALPYFVMCGIGVLIIAFLIDDLTYKEPPQGFVSAWKEAVPNILSLSWSDIGKLTFIFFAPFLVVMIGLAWLLHGFGFFIIKG